MHRYSSVSWQYASKVDMDNQLTDRIVEMFDVPDVHLFVAVDTDGLLMAEEPAAALLAQHIDTVTFE